MKRRAYIGGPNASTWGPTGFSKELAKKRRHAPPRIALPPPVVDPSAEIEQLNARFQAALADRDQRIAQAAVDSAVPLVAQQVAQQAAQSGFDAAVAFYRLTGAAPRTVRRVVRDDAGRIVAMVDELEAPRLEGDAPA